MPDALKHGSQRRLLIAIALPLAVGILSGISFRDTTLLAAAATQRTVVLAQRATTVQDTGARVYAIICASCHQPTGVGLDTTFPPLDGSEWVVGSPERLIRIIIHGVTGEIEVQGEFFRGLMPPWGPTLKDFDVAAVATHVRGSWGNKATAISESTVARIRKSTAWRTTPWTQAELRRFPP